MRQGSGPLAPDEIAIRGRHAPVPRADQIAVGAHAPRAARFAPLEPRSKKYFIQAFALGLPLYLQRAGDHPSGYPRRDMPVPDHGRGRSQVGQPAVRTRSYEHTVDRDPIDGLRSEEHTSELPSLISI